MLVPRWDAGEAWDTDAGVMEITSNKTAATQNWIHSASVTEGKRSWRRIFESLIRQDDTSVLLVQQQAVLKICMMWKFPKYTFYFDIHSTNTTIASFVRLVINQLYLNSFAVLL